MGAALLVVLWLVAIASAYFLMANGWWLPQAASAGAAALDRDLILNFTLFGILFLAAQLALGYFVWRYRASRDSKLPRYIHGHTGLELTWTAIAAILFLGIALRGYGSWTASDVAPSSDALTVEVTGVQFQWYFRYPGPDGRFGRLRPELQDASLGNPLGLDDADPDGKDDVVSGILNLPLDREVDVRLRSTDVIHSFFVPAMRVKQDAVPGLMISTRFQPTAAGDFELACAELCGLGHYRMKATVRVLPAEQFAAWMAAEQTGKAQP